MKLLKHRTLEKDLQLLAERAKEVEQLSVREVLEILAGKGRSVVLIFLCLPFCQPIQIPGFSIPFGLAIAFIGLRMAFGKRMWIPKRIQNYMLSAASIEKTAQKGLSLLEKLKKITHPRWKWLCEWSIILKANGLLLLLLGLLLALPLPIPLTNLAAGWAILLLSVGLLEDDGLLVVLSYVVTLATAGALFLVYLYMKNMF